MKRVTIFKHGGLKHGGAIALNLLLAGGLAHAQSTDPAQPPDPPKTLWDRPNLIGDWGGARTRLADHGLTFGLNETSEVLGNASGGVRRGAVYEGLTQMGIGIDTEKAFGLVGGTFNISAYQIHGRGLSLNNLNSNINTVSSIEAYRGTLLFELWYEQSMLNKTLAIRVGQMAADQEFMISTNAALFINHTFGWSSLPSADLPSAGPAYPLATPGVRVRYTPSDSLAVLAAVFNGDPVGPGPGTPQDRNPSGTAFRVNDGVFAIMEAQYSINQGEAAAGLPGTYKLGGAWNSQPFADQRYAASGLSLADPAAAGQPARAHRGNVILYGIADQMLHRTPGTKDGGLGAFARLMGAPGDRNLISVYMDAGLTCKGLVNGRENDTAGLALAYARIGDGASGLDSDTARFTGAAYPVRRNETVLELTYQAALTPWLLLQPNAQYVFNLGGGTLNPLNPTRRLGDAAIFGLRTSATF
jgi:porin